MKTPLPRRTPIDIARMSSWLADFSGYRHSVTEGRIDRWLEQFDAGDRDLAARVLDAVDFVSREQMHSALRSALAAIDGWSLDEGARRGRWRFVAFAVSAGESGDEMLRTFRSANGLSGRRYNELFIHKSELVREELGPEDTVVFIDDFAGTGKQAVDVWPEMRELLAKGPRSILVLIGASDHACTRIEQDTELVVLRHIALTASDNVFAAGCPHFTSDEQSRLLQYCTRADRRAPRGFGDCGFVVVFAHTCPNNSIPILRTSHPGWEGLFRRYR